MSRMKLLAFAAALALAACTPPSSSAPPPNDPLMQKAARDGSVRVIAILKAPATVTPQALGALQTAALDGMRGKGVVSATAISDTLPLIVADVTAKDLATMRADPAVATIVEDRLALPNLAQAGPLIGAPQARAKGATGKGQAVAILDTGVDASHPFFGKRVTVEACFSTTSAAQGATSACPNGQSEMIGTGAAKPCSAGGCDHGTHVAGIAAGSGKDFSGVAPEADIIAVQVFSVFDARVCGGFGRGGSCVASFTSDQIRALDFVLQQAKTRPVAAVNMSLGGDRSTTACDDDVTKLVIDDLRAAGVATVIAAGNDGFTDSVSQPGCISTAITVSATDKSDVVANFSNRSAQTDVYAPGVAILSSIPGGGFTGFSGTSMATPFVAGAIAALRSLKPTATLAEIEAALVSTGAPIADPATKLAKTRINVDAAAVKLGARPLEAPPVAAAAEPAASSALAAIAALPPDQTVRVIATLAASDDAALAAAMDAATKAGAKPQKLRAGMMVVEGPARAVQAFATSPHVRRVQIDATARPQ